VIPNYKSPGTENLRGQHKAKTSAPPELPGGGKDVGGKANLRADAKVKTSPPPGIGPKGGYDHKVGGVQSFTDGRV